MAVTSFGVNDPQAVKLWSKALAHEVLKATWAYKFMGEESSSIIQIKDETRKGAGDKITYGLRMQLNGLGTVGDGALAGNEEALSIYSDAVVINQLRHAVRSGGRMSQQRVPFDVRQEALSGLRDWWSNKMDLSFFNQICGNTAEATYVATGGTQNTGLQAPLSVDSYHRKDVIGGSADESLGSSNTFSLTVIDRAREAARTLTPAIRPTRIDGKDYYVGFLHSYQVTDMRTNTATGQWFDIEKAAMTGGEVEDNPIVDGALGIYNGVILHEDYRVTTGVNSSTASTAVSTVRRGVLAGAQAAMVAFGRDNGAERYSWVEELFDYENQLGVSAGLIFGLKKTQFNSKDYASVLMSSYAVAH
ncbi:MAG: N4-gp56 family major capsid protein [Patescibacteria group bacterium]|nr:N4-gp56 family major capsid protein [Patescibacteria group bacterium]